MNEATETFMADLMDHDDTTMMDRYYYSGNGAILDAGNEAALRREISDRFGVSMRDVLLVGSAKLGFTIKAKPGRPEFSPFGDTSDIDVAIISSQLFLEYWQYAFDFWMEQSDWDQAGRFRKYLFRGWLRPDKLPNSPDFTKSRDWFEFFRALQATGKYGGFKIAAGVYFNETFWESYVGSALSDCRRSLEEGL